MCAMLSDGQAWTTLDVESVHLSASSLLDVLLSERSRNCFQYSGTWHTIPGFGFLRSELPSGSELLAGIHFG